MQRLLQPGEVERLELLGPADRRRRVPAQAGVDHQLQVLAQPFAGGADVGDVARLALAHRPPAELDGPVALAGQLLADAFGLGGRVAEQDGGVGRNVLRKPPPSSW